MPVKVCALHLYHSPRPQQRSIEIHHVWPMAWGGPDIPANRVAVCATSHSNLHDLLDRYRALGGKPPWIVLRQFSPAERQLAALGWDREMRGAM